MTDQNLDRTLSVLKEGESGTVKEVRCGGAERGRLLELGLTAGTEVTCVGRSPHGDPKAYLIRGAVVALRTRDSKKIVLEAPHGTDR